ncbi:MAG TPA: vWA domain-containing protein [Polyangiaceae bacterium]|nr:vWA domain-containing protein [Polyangiaceae bacterium]
MLKLGSIAFSISASALLFACSQPEDDDGAGAGGASAGSGGVLIGSGGMPGLGGSPGLGGLPGQGGSVTLPVGGTPNTGGGNTAGVGNLPGKFEGGTVPINNDDYDSLKNSACTGWASEGETLPAQLELVIDVSSSMNQKAPGSNRTKWEVTRDALLEAIPGVTGPGLPPSLAVGLLFYPNLESKISTGAEQDSSACVNTAAAVPMALLGSETAEHRTLVANRISTAQLFRSTPTHDAYEFALNNAVIPSKLSGEKFMLLITDGAPTLSHGCVNPNGTQLTDVNPQPIVEAITRAANEHVRTFLIGSPGSENNRAWMSRAAVIGGTAPAGCQVNGPAYCHMDMTTAPDFAEALREGLAQVVGQVTPCTFTFAEPPAGQEIDPEKINVISTNSTGSHSLIVRDDVNNCKGEGWQLTGDQEIKLCPTTCSQVKADVGATIDVVFGCGSIPLPPPR